MNFTENQAELEEKTNEEIDEDEDIEIPRLDEEEDDLL